MAKQLEDGRIEVRCRADDGEKVADARFVFGPRDPQWDWAEDLLKEQEQEQKRLTKP